MTLGNEGSQPETEIETKVALGAGSYLDASSGTVALSPMQRSLLSSHRRSPGSPVQNMSLLSHIEGQVDPQLLIVAFASLVEHVDVLRTRIEEVGGTITVTTDAEIQKPDLIELDRELAPQWATSRALEPLALSTRCYDSAILVHDDGTISWYLNLHHVITDATSSALVFERTAEIYAGLLVTAAEAAGNSETISSEPTNPEPTNDTQYYEWAKELGRTLAPEASTIPGATGRALSYWQDRTSAQKVGRLYSQVEDQSPEADRAVLPLDGELLETARLRLSTDYSALSDDLGWSVLLVTATALYLHRLSGEPKLSVGLPVHNRSNPLARGLIGPMMEVFPVDVVIEQDDTHRSLHKRVSRSILKTLQNASPGTSPPADFESIVNVIPRAALQTFCGYEVATSWHHPGAIDASHLLRVQMTSYARSASPDESGYEFVFDLNSASSKGRSAADAASHFMSILTGLIEEPDGSIGESAMCSPADLSILVDWESGPPAEVHPQAIVQRMEEVIAARTYVVIEDSERVFSGQELWQWILSTAAWMRSTGVEPGNRVAIELERSIEAVVAVFATMACGGSFVPIDPSQPQGRRTALIERAGCALTVSSAASVADARFQFEPEPFTTPASGEQEAYLLFTSGSTGEPKGVPISHQGFSGYLEFALASYFDSQKPIVAPLFSALTFDLTLTTLFAPLLARGRLVIIEPDGPQGLAQIAANKEISWCKATPSHLEILVKLLPEDHHLQTLVVGGEAFGARLGRDLLQINPDMVLFNEYGPTEAVVGCMLYQAEPDLLETESEVPIGAPSPGVTLRVVDTYLRRVPPGVTGELLIAHSGLTAGYLATPGGASPDGANPDKTSPGQFDSANKAGQLGKAPVVESPTSPFVELDGQRFYRSGDLVRLMDPDRLVYMGRSDEQIKVGGIRLEPVEVEEALDSHPLVERSAVRLWNPQHATPSAHCIRCGLPDNVPGVAFDEIGVCQTCYDYERVAPITASWFKNPEDLHARIAGPEESAKPRGDYDCLHLLSGGKDSTYALYQLVELGLRPYALTLDNGFISEGAKENARRSVADLGVDHEFATSDVMNEILQDSLETYSNVCHGCYKTIYTLATTRAAELNIPFIVTGLSRGQLFETRLIPQQFSESRFDPDAIDRAVLQARRAYHSVDDGPNRLLDTSVFEKPGIFDQVEYIDFYRYFDVELEEMLSYLTEQAPWVRPPDTGRSTNCLINAAGIHTHLLEQGYHNYAVPYAWDVRLGHKTRDEAIEELDDREDLSDVLSMLGDVGYQPNPRSVLTGYYEPSQRPDSDQLTPAVLRTYLADLLPAHSIPSAFVEVEELPLSSNGKLDAAALPTPDRVHRSSSALHIEPVNDTQFTVVKVWERILKVEPISIDDDFFALGGDSLAALEMIVAVSDRLGRSLSEELAFVHTTPRHLADAIDVAKDDGSGVEPLVSGTAGPADFERAPGSLPRLASNERAILFDQAIRPDAVMYNSCRVFLIEGLADSERLVSAIEAVVERHETLRWNYGPHRVDLNKDASSVVDLTQGDTNPAVAAVTEGLVETSLLSTMSRPSFAAMAEEFCRRPFDLERGPLIRAVVAAIEPGLDSSQSNEAHKGSEAQPTSAVAIAFHHVSGDADSFEILWQQIDDHYCTGNLPAVTATYDGISAWQDSSLSSADKTFWLEQGSSQGPAAKLTTFTKSVTGGYGAGFTTRRIAVTPQELEAVQGKSSFALSLTAVVAALRPYCDGDEIELGVITSTRNHKLADDVVGYFLNTLPIRLTCQPDLPLAGIADDASAKIGSALAHRTYPLARIVADRREEAHSNPEYDGSTSVPSILVTFEGLSSVTLDGATVEPDVLWNADPVSDITFFVGVRDTRIDLSIEYSAGTLTPAIANELLKAVDSALRQIVDDASVSVSSLAGPGFQKFLIGPSLDDETLVLERIRGWMAEKSEEIAVACGDETITWAELDQKTKAAAAHLRSLGVKAGHRVLICQPRSIDLVVSLLAVQRAGASYVPIDVSYPDERVELLAAQSKASIGIVEQDLSSIVETAISVQDLLAGATSLAGEPSDDWPSTSDPAGHSTEAYVIFTSGSTGEPKGVAVSHAQLAASTNARFEFYKGNIERFVMVSSPAFDSSIVGLFWTLADGGTVELPTELQAHDIDALIDLLSANGVSHTLMVPTLYQAVLTRRNATDRAAGEWPRQIIVAGETCQPSLVELHDGSTTGSQLTNEYGPTETTVWSNVHNCVAGEPVPIGQPIPGAWVAVAAQDGRPLPNGVAGELIIGGAGVTNGYINNDVETNKRFGEHVTHGRFFRTGDAAAIVDGTVFFMGRTDNQLSVNGSRIEPEEVEQVLTRVPGVSSAVVVGVDVRSVSTLLEELPASVVRDAMAVAATQVDPTAALEKELRVASQTVGATGQKIRLVAHVEVDDEPELQIADLREAASKALPPLHRPGLFVSHPRLPRTPNGKIDRVAAQLLPIPEEAASSVESTRSVTTLESAVSSMTTQSNETRAASELLASQITELFRRSLRNPMVGPDDSFFDLGGHSLLAMELLFELEDLHGDRIGAGVLYESPTPNQLAAVLQSNKISAEPVVAKGTRPGSVGATVESPTPTGPSRRRTFLLPIQPEGSKAPIFGVHVLGVNSIFFRPLSEHLGHDQPLYGLGQPTTMLDTSVPSAVATIAEAYADEIELVAPTGPVSLAAVSLGGVVAYELAQQLLRRGRQIGILILFDGAGPYMIDKSMDLAQRIGFHTDLLRNDGLGYVRQRVDRRLNLWQRESEKAKLAVRQRLNLAVDHHLEIRQFIESNIAAQQNYDFEPFSGRMVNFKATEDPLLDHHIAIKMGWNGLIAGGFELIDVPGGHISMLAEPHIKTLAARLAAAHEKGSALATEEAREGIDLDNVKRRFIADLGQLNIQRSVSRLEKRSDLSVEAELLVTRVATICEKISNSVQSAGEAVVEELRQAGLQASLLPVPQRSQLNRGTVAITGMPFGDDSEVAATAMERLGYAPQMNFGGDRSTTEFVRPDVSTTTMTLHWDQDEDAKGSRTGLLKGRLREAGQQTKHRISGLPYRPEGADLGDLGIFLGTPVAMIEPLLRFAGAEQGELLADIGCGDGRFLIEAAQRFGCRGLGVEHNEQLVEAARVGVETAGLSDQIEIVHGDANDMSLAGVDIAFAFLPPEVTAGIVIGALERLAPTSRFVTHEQLTVLWPRDPDQTELLLTDDSLTVASLWNGLAAE